jgi:dipeptidyl aminopeptidase/acylaminoacyl peptidase
MVGSARQAGKDMKAKKMIETLCCMGALMMTLTASAEEQVLSLEQASEIFAQRGFVTNIKISPDGEHYFVVAEQNEDQTLSIFKLESNELVRVVNFDRRWQAGSITWISQNEIAISPDIRPLDDYRRLSVGQLVVVDLEDFIEPVFGSLVKTQTGSIAGRRSIVSEGNAALMDPLLDQPGWIKIKVAKDYRLGFAELEFKTGRIRNLEWGPNRGCQFVMDENAEVRLCTTEKMENGHQLDSKIYEIYAFDGSQWELIYESPEWHFTRVFTPYDGIDKFLVMKESPSSRQGLYEFETKTKTFKELYTDPDFDLSWISYDRQTGIAAIEAHNPMPNYIYLEASGSAATVHQQLAAAFPEHYVNVTSYTEDETKLIFRVSSSQNPGTFYLFDRQKSQIRYLADYSPEMAALPFKKMEPFNFTSDDGLKIHGLFTPGVGQDSKGSVVIAHGGPHGPYDRWGFRGSVHFFSQLGYNVIQVNFRGSGGFGRKFEEAGYLEWSGKMIDDIIDGVRFISEKKNLPDARCIYGGSYGGFAAASAAFRYPDFFDCAAGHVGVYDLESKIYNTGDINDYKAGIDYLNRVLGTDNEKRRNDSPVNNVDKIKIPMLLTHGNQDYRADVVHSKLMERRLRSLGKEVETMYVMRETHGFASTENEKKRLTQLGAFVERHTAQKINLASLHGGR